MNVALIGGSGLIGSNVVTSLIQQDTIKKITLIVRKELIQLKDTEKVEQIIIPDMSAISIQKLDVNADIFFCSLGTTIKTAGSKANFRNVDLNLVTAFADIAKISNAKCFVFISAMGANSNSFIFYNKVKGEVEDYIRALDLPAVYCIRPSLIIGERTEARFAESIGTSIFNVLDTFLHTKTSAMLGSKVPNIIARVNDSILKTEQGFHIVNAKDI